MEIPSVSEKKKLQLLDQPLLVHKLRILAVSPLWVGNHQQGELGTLEFCNCFRGEIPAPLTVQ